MDDAAYRHGFMTKLAERGYADYVMPPAGAVAGAAGGALAAGGVGALAGGFAGGVNSAIIARALARNRHPLVKSLATLLGAGLGTAAGGTVGAVSGGLEGAISGSQIGWRRGRDGWNAPARRGDIGDAVRANAAANILTPGLVPAYVERTTASLPRALAASQINELSNMAVAPVLATKLMRGKGMGWGKTAIAGILAKILTGTGLTMAMTHKGGGQ